MENLTCGLFSIVGLVIVILAVFSIGYSLGQENSYLHNRISNVHTRLDLVWQSIIKLMRKSHGENQDKP